MIPIIDTGHGKMINGDYQTSGKRSPNWHQGVLYEGMFNNWVGNRVIEELDRKGIPYYHVSPEYTDITLQTRVERANRIYEENPNTYLLSIHANGGGGKGIEGFTHVGLSPSDAIATKFLNNFQSYGLNKIRTDFSDGDPDKEKNFFVLEKTKGPSFLLECGFMDHPEDYENLWDRNYLCLVVDCIVEVIEDLYKEQNIA